MRASEYLQLSMLVKQLWAMVVLQALVFVAFTTLIQATWGAAVKPDKLSIVGGHDVSIEDAPYMVSAFYKGRRICGGSIVHDQFILTAAHCVIYLTVDVNEWKVLIGTGLLNQGGVFIGVARIIVHEKYYTAYDGDDIALIKLDKLVLCNWNTAQVALPEDDRHIIEGTIANVTGWGWTKDGGSISSNELRQTSVPVVSNVCCLQFYSYLNDRHMCAGSPGHDSCQGDSGGPLTYEGVQIGIVSFGKRCGESPGVYTRVASFLGWIHDTISKNLK